MPFKDPQKRKEYQKKWREENREYFREWARNNAEKVRSSVKRWRDKNKEHCTKKTIEWHRKHPWIWSYNGAKHRCTSKKAHNYHRYGGRGIEFKLTRKEVKELWFRDKAYLLNRPSIDRINNDGNYEYSNCRFIEMSENHKRVKFKHSEETKRKMSLIRKAYYQNMKKDIQ